MDDLDIFSAALELETPEERRKYLNDACGENALLRARIEALLRSAAEASRFMESPAPCLESTPTIDLPISERPGDTIGPYKLLQQIGEGGMGVVYMAEQTKPVERRVALKIIKPGMDTRQVIARFEAERQALAMMDHPNIAKVLDAGATGTGRPYFVMELVKGQPITQYCDEQLLSPRERLQLFLPICQAVQHAHQKGVIHRDLKPSNILIARYDDKPVPKVIDFGVAKATSQKLTEKTMFTQYGQLVGTIDYMSPEQARFNQLDVDTRSDIYSLGVLLYELLTGETPFDRTRLRTAAFEELLRIIREEEPPRPSVRLSSCETIASVAANRQMDPHKLGTLVRGELDWIVMKALEKDRSRRYETASGFAADVERYLNDEPVQACPPSVWYRFRKFSRRNKVALTTASVILLTISVAVAFSTVLIWRANRDLQLALNREQRDSYFHRISLAHRELSMDNLGRALELLDECPEELRGWEWQYLTRLCRAEPVVLRDTTELTGLAFSPDGDHLVSAGADGRVKLWNFRTGDLIKSLLMHADSVVSVAVHPLGMHVASAGLDRRVKVWELATGQVVFEERIDVHNRFGTARVVAFSPDGRHLAAGKSGAVNLWDWKNHQHLHTLAGHEKLPISVAFGRDGGLASGGWRGTLNFWDANLTRKPIATIDEHRHPISALSFSPDGRRLASASFDRCVKVWDVSTGKRVQNLRHSTGLVLGVAFSPDGRRIASAGEDKIVHIWDADTGREVLGLRGHTAMSGCLEFSPDGRYLASASMDGTIRIWDAAPLEGNEGQETRTFLHHNDEVWSLAISPDGQTIVSGGFDKPVKVWDVRTGRVRINFQGHDQIVFCVGWDPDGERIASAGWVGAGLFTVKVWNPRTGKEFFSLPAGPEYFAADFSSDGRYLVTGRANGTIEVWDLALGRPEKPIATLGTRERSMIRAVVFSRDGKHLVSAGDDGKVKLWDATRLDQKQEARLVFRARVPGPCLNVAFSPDGRWLATAGHENTVKIWNSETGQELHTLRGHSREIYSVAFSPDGRWVASAGEDSTVKIWDSRSGELVRNFRGHTGLVSSLAFSPDGRRLYSGSRDKSIKEWNVSQLIDSLSDCQPCRQILD